MASSDGKNWFANGYFITGYWNTNWWPGEVVAIIVSAGKIIGSQFKRLIGG